MGCMCSPVVLSVILLLVAVLYFKVKRLFERSPIPQLPEIWWGPRNSSEEDTEIKPFKVSVSDEVIKDLQQRLENALPFTEPLEGVNHNYGLNTKLLNNIVEFWKTKYNWREREEFLNQYPQYRVSIQGLKIHFLHVKPKETKGLKVLPLLLVHGWPGSIREFYEIIPLFTTPQKGRDFVFEVVVPSLPFSLFHTGYGFSEAAIRPGLGVPQISLIFKTLMEKLGYKEYYLQGGDWGSAIVQTMSILFPEQIIGVHSNMCVVQTPLAYLKKFICSFYPRLIVSKELESYVYPLSKIFSYTILESGYFHLQASKPDTIGVALGDSPVGLAAYILEKFITWTNPAFKDLKDGGLTTKYTLTNLLDNVMIYWVSRSITTSMRLYAEQFSKNKLNLSKFQVEVPIGCARFYYDLFFEPESILRGAYKNLIHISEYEGGHFAAFELPEVLAKDVYTFVEKVEAL